MKKNLIGLILISIFFNSAIFGQNGQQIYKDKNAPIEKRVNNLLSLMTLEEKILMLGGTGFTTQPIERLGIPSLNMADGPLGVRWDNSTAFPSGIAMSSTWDPELIYKVGNAIGEETKAHGRNVILGPCVNIARIPQGGRNFESFGEDPFLTSKMGVAYIKGVQNNNVVATVKHFACNNQELERMFVDTKVDERTLNEIYLPAFKAAVKEADVMAVMSAYNKLNGHYASESDYLLVNKLKKEWNFKGFVMSDWGAVHSSEATYNSGLDVEMPTGVYLNDKSFVKKLLANEYDLKKLDDKISRMLTVMFKIGLFDNYQYDKSKLNTEEHKKLAYEVAADGMVLLKNSHSILPIDKEAIGSIAIIGPNAAYTRTGGGGSSLVSPFYTVSPLEGITNKFGNQIEINYAPGLLLDGDAPVIEPKYFYLDKDGSKSGINVKYFNNKTISGNPILERVESSINNFWSNGEPVDGIGNENFSVVYEGYIKFPKSGSTIVNVTSDDGSRLYIEDELVIDDWNDHGMETKSFAFEVEKDKLYKIKLEYYENMGDAGVKLGWQLPINDLLQQAIDVAKKSDLAIVFVGTSAHYETEGKDRDDLVLPNGQDELINAVYSANKNVIIVITSGSPVLMDKWIDKVPAVLQTWFAGQELGNAVADILFGNVNPSGKLTISYPNKWEDCSAFGSYNKESGLTEYNDGIYVGYRHFEKKGIKPLFPFGYGLSYSHYVYSDLKIDEDKDNFTVTFNIQNNGAFKGKETAQLYISPINPKVDRPIKELKGFVKLPLNPKEKKNTQITINKKDFSYFDIKLNDFVVDKGEYLIQIGNSSQNILLEKKIEIK